ncbi:hypothetical protein Tsubulata_027157 [Turnera subulata]|uniref:Peptidase A1 domain-containing protein n=1 Tax=Turnera subulata TaxID=218843 RepID=A0A9Q0FJG3_9ROSI|nr:hypothetical protein Tsubulata_027157 [Turnera subulata]
MHRNSISPQDNHNDASAYKTTSIPNAYLDTDPIANVVSGFRNNIFYVNFSIGNPPIPQLAVMDTGSNLLWVKCSPCIPCYYAGSAQVFEPSKSSTFHTMPCEKYGCSSSECNSDKQCPYNISYISGAVSHGIFASEQLTFETPDGGSFIVPNARFGCSRLVEGDQGDGQFSGIFALGPRSIVNRRLGSKFSYCIGSIRDPYYPYNNLRIGSEAIMEGYSTPLLTDGRFYYVTLEGISIGETKIEIPRSTSQATTWDKEGVVFDSGSQYTWLGGDRHLPLRTEVKRIIGTLLERYDDKEPWHLCYYGQVERDLQGFPVVTFHFADGADLDLDTGSLFFEHWPGTFCLAVGPTHAFGEDERNLSIIGVMAQQNYNVGYDLTTSKLYLQRIDCELLED